MTRKVFKMPPRRGFVMLGSLLALMIGISSAGALTRDRLSATAGVLALSTARLGGAMAEASALGIGDPSLIGARAERVPLIAPKHLTMNPAPAGSDLQCLSLLFSESRDFEEAPATEGIATPVRFRNFTVGGVYYRHYWRGPGPRVIDCRLALALWRAGPVLLANAVREVLWVSHYRPSQGKLKPGAYHFHAQGLALDVKGFRVGKQRMKVMVDSHYERGLGFQIRRSCLGRPLTMRGMLLRKIACDLDAGDAFEAILTPDFDAQHWNHFHLSAFHSAQVALFRPRGTALLEVPVSDLTLWAIRRPLRQDPGQRRWDRVAAQAWPKRYDWVRERLGLRPPATPAQDAAALLAATEPPGDLLGLLKALGRQLAPELDDLLSAMDSPAFLEAPPSTLSLP